MSLNQHIYPAKKYNSLQNEAYQRYCEKCESNGVAPAKFSRYFQHAPNYGYVYSIGDGFIWRKTKTEILSYLQIPYSHYPLYGVKNPLK